MRTDAPPTVKQIYAIAAALCAEKGDELPESRSQASELIRNLTGNELRERGRSAPAEEVISKRYHRAMPNLHIQAVPPEVKADR